MAMPPSGGPNIMMMRCCIKSKPTKYAKTFCQMRGIDKFAVEASIKPIVTTNQEPSIRREL